MERRNAEMLKVEMPKYGMSKCEMTKYRTVESDSISELWIPGVGVSKHFTTGKMKCRNVEM
jgi:hypothetical protein